MDWRSAVRLRNWPLIRLLSSFDRERISFWLAFLLRDRSASSPLPARPVAANGNRAISA